MINFLFESSGLYSLSHVRYANKTLNRGKKFTKTITLYSCIMVIIYYLPQSKTEIT